MYICIRQLLEDILLDELDGLLSFLDEFMVVLIELSLGRRELLVELSECFSKVSCEQVVKFICKRGKIYFIEKNVK